MSASEIFDQAAEDIMDNIGDSAVFYPASGDPIPCLVDINQEASLEPNHFDTQVHVKVVTIQYLFSDIGREAKRGERFIVNGDTWTVDSPFEDSNSNDMRFRKVVVRK